MPCRLSSLFRYFTDALCQTAPFVVARRPCSSVAVALPGQTLWVGDTREEPMQNLAVLRRMTADRPCEPSEVSHINADPAVLVGDLLATFTAPFSVR